MMKKIKSFKKEKLTGGSMLITLTVVISAILIILFVVIYLGLTGGPFKEIGDAIAKMWENVNIPFVT